MHLDEKQSRAPILSRNNSSSSFARGLSEGEISVTIYHEILEAATVASIDPPEAVRSFNEGDFERAGYRAHELFGPASPENLDRMLQFYGF